MKKRKKAKAKLGKEGQEIDQEENNDQETYQEKDNKEEVSEKEVDQEKSH